MNRTAAEYNKNGKDLYRRGKYEEAAQSFSTGVTYDPRSASLRYNLAATMFKKGDMEAAASEAEMALAISPGYQKAQDLLEALRAISFTDDLDK